jgi:Cu/Zn superoxide dismutase
VSAELFGRETMHRVGWFAGAALIAALLAALALGGSAALAEEAGPVTLTLTPSRDSGVSGTAALRDAEGGVEVALGMRGLPEAGVEHINHFHGGGTCAEDRAGRTAPVTIPLDPVVAREDGTGSATTTLRGVTLEQLFDGTQERFLLLHAEAYKGEGVPPGIACADLALAASGGVSPPVPLLFVGLFLAMGVAAGWLASRWSNDQRVRLARNAVSTPPLTQRSSQKRSVSRRRV